MNVESLYYPATVVEGKSWYIKYYYMNPSGQMVRFRETFGLNRIKSIMERRRRAKDVCNNINKKLNQGYNPFVDSSKLSLTDVNIMDALTFAKNLLMSSFRESTKKSYKSTFGIFSKWLHESNLKGLKIGEFTSDFAQQFFDYRKVCDKVSNKTLENNKLVLSSFFSVLSKRKYIYKNPIADTERIKVSGTDRNFITKQDSKTILPYLSKHHPNYLMVVKFVYYCLMRPKEIALLQVKHVRLSQKKMVLPASMVKSKRQCIKVIPNGFHEDLQYLKNYEDDFFVFGKDFLPNLKGISKNTLSSTHTKIMREMGVYQKGKTLYSWKDTGVIKLVEAGIPITDIMEQCNHKDISTTQKYIKTLGYGASDKLKDNYPTI